MGQFDDERTVELKAQLNSAFAQRAGNPGYGADGWKTPGLDNQATRDESRRMEQNQKQVMRVAQRNAVKALKSGNAEAWQHWSNVAGGKTFGINDAEQRSDTAALGADRNAQNAFRLNGGATTNEPQEAAGAIEQAAAGQAATSPAATPPSAPATPANTIPDKKDGESSFAYAERLAQMRGKQEGVFGDDVNDIASGLRDRFAKQDALGSQAASAKPVKDDGWEVGLTGFYPEKGEAPKPSSSVSGPFREFFDTQAKKAKEAKLEAPMSDDSLFAGDWTKRPEKDVQFTGTLGWSKSKGAATPESEAKYSALAKEVGKDYDTAARLADTAEPFIIAAQSPRIQKFAAEHLARKGRELESKQLYATSAQPGSPL